MNSDTTNHPASSTASDGLEDDTAARLARRPWPATPLRPGIEVSFEFFPPATETGKATLARCVSELAPLGPKFVSVTYGAGGTTQDRTQSTVNGLIADTNLQVAGHLTCVGATRSEVGGVIDDYISAGVRHIVALRGDAPNEDGASRSGGSDEAGYSDAAELVEGIRRHGDDSAADAMLISVGAYPEVHPKATSASADLDVLKAKFDAGADQAITQFFFDTDVFLRFHESARSAGITNPIIPGIMPVTNFANICRFSDRCGTEIPPWMHDLFAGLDEAPDVRQMIAATVAAEQCRRLAEHGVTQFHFYTMNQSALTAAVCRILGVTPSAAKTRAVRAS